MNIDRLDQLEWALVVLGKCEACIISRYDAPGHINPHVNLEVKRNRATFLMLYDDNDAETSYITEKNKSAHSRLSHQIELAKRNYPGFEGYGIVKDFFLNWDTTQRKEYIKCSTNIFELTFMRFYANGKRKLKTICKILDRRIAKLRKNLEKTNDRTE